MIFALKHLIVFTVLSGALLLTGAPGSTSAHHGGFVNWEQELLIGPVDGVATELAFRFPHPQMSLEITDESGSVESWTLALRPTPTGLRSRGWNRNTVTPGDTISIIYSPHVSASNVGIVRRLVVNGEFIPIEPGDEECRTATVAYRRCADVQ